MIDSNKGQPQIVLDTDFKDVDLSSQDERNECNGAVPATDITNEKKEEPENVNTEDENAHITWRICKNYKISICKPLIPLKMALLVWFGAGSIIGSFLAVYFKQRGLALSELSTIFIIAPFAQFLGTAVSGVIADKLGRSKPVLVGNLIITLLAVAGMLLMPRMNPESCNQQPLNLKCHYLEFDRLIARSACDIEEDIIEVTSCSVQCPENVTQYCFGRNLICEILARNQEFGNFSLSIHVNGTFKIKHKCFYNVHTLTHKNITYSWCNVPHKMYCRINCSYFSEEKCNREGKSRWKLLIANVVLFILFLTTFTTCYRIFDVTAMSLVKQYNSDFGHERFFSILGVLIFSPVAGYIVDANTSPGEEKHYASAFYCFIGMCIIILAIIYKLDVQIMPPGKNMWKKILNLLKNADVISFICVLLVLGTTWNFTKNFTNWFLAELNTPGVLFGLIPAVSGLYGLPFLMTSKWWVQKIGSPNIFILALLAYVCSAIGYSFLFDPWYSLFLEVTSIFTYHLLWVAVILHSHEIAPEGLTATVISTAGGIHYSIGKGSGSLIGGLIMDSFGGRIAYRVIAIICLISAVIYGIYLYIRRICFTENHDIKNRDIDENLECEEESKEIYALESKI
ncbi:Major facilitator superfamily domain-containing protein 6, partial [Stegodyphus mimosarum]